MNQPTRSPFCKYFLLFLFCCSIVLLSCRGKTSQSEQTAAPPETDDRIKVIFDTDANNELDDQHALAYLLFNGDLFDVKAVTVNATFNGGEIQGHYDEAARVLQLCNLLGKVPLLNGANASFQEIEQEWDKDHYDGQDAVDSILEMTKENELIIIAVGKLTNIALALKKDPGFAKRTKIVWLGSNYPEPGEYNQVNDTVAMNYVLNTDIPFEMVTVRYGQPSGTDAVSVTQTEINEKMPGLGVVAEQPITGRHGGEFNTFGDYSVNLFEYIDYHGDPPSRPLFDMVAVALLKNQKWGKAREIPAPVFIDDQWVERPQNERKILVWENFDRDGLIEDFFEVMSQPNPINTGQ